jgi:serine/threonine protein kinase
MQSPEYPQALSGSRLDNLNSLVGKSLGRFRLVEKIGEGGMATVFKAYQSALDRYVALKILARAHDPIFRKRFVQEARAVARLAHPNIVQIHDFGEQDNILYIVMEYVDGGTLRDRLRLKGALPVPEAVDFILQAALGLQCAHRNGIIHRDVKPSNMLLRRDDHLLLSDFGIAKILEGNTELTRTGSRIGTPEYMSPEQGTGGPVDGRSDIYSLGITFFHCLSGHVPFQSDHYWVVMTRHIQDPLPLEFLRAAGVPAPIEQVVLKMTAKSPQDRYQSIDALIDALETARAAIGLGSPRSRPLSVIAPPPPRSEPPITLACFRCGMANATTQIFCTSCGYELADSGAAKDRYVTPDGRVVLASLTWQTGVLAGRSYRFHQDVTTIGRTNGNDFVIPGRTVSRRHARLWFNQGRWYLEDLQSANGTMVNGVRITQAMLNDGDRVQFGDECAIFRIVYK